MNRKKWLFLLMLLPALSSVTAQLSITLQVPPAGVLQKTQLWNMLLVNAGTETYEAEVNITVSSGADNNPVMTATGRTVKVPKGATQLRYADFTPVSYKYLSAAFNNDLRPEGFLPVGNYTVCYTVGRWKGDAFEPLTEDCITLEIQPLSPPVLYMPFDGDTVSTPYPQFAWLPPAPLSLFSSLSYDIIVAPILNGQSPLQAVQQNMPVYSAGNIATVTSVYPASSHALDTAQWYAWAVVARNNNQVVAQSEVWSFLVRSNSVATTDKPERNLIALRRDQEATGVTTISEGKLGISFYSFDPAHETEIDFIDAAGVVVKKIKQQINYGANYWWLDPGKAVEANKYYKVVLKDQSEHLYTAFFVIKK